MKTHFLRIAALVMLVSTRAVAQQPAIVVEKGQTTTMSGLAGYARIAYAFAKGDHVTVAGEASKKLAYMHAIVFPETEVCRVKQSRHVNCSFDMKEDGIVVIKFVSDRGGKNTIDYAITRQPASAATQNYVTRITWEKPSDGVGGLIPKQAKQ